MLIDFSDTHQKLYLIRITVEKMIKTCSTAIYLEEHDISGSGQALSDAYEGHRQGLVLMVDELPDVAPPG